MRNHPLLAGTSLLLLMFTGCISIKNRSAHESWPKPLKASAAKQFDGVYRNRSLDARTGDATNRGQQLFDFLIGHGSRRPRDGQYVELHAAPGGNVLHVRLLDGQRQEIDSTNLLCTVHFDLSGGSVILHGPFSGWHGTDGNLGPYTQHRGSRLYLSTSGDLLGKSTEWGACLLFCLIPTIGYSKQWMSWPTAPLPRGATP